MENKVRVRFAPSPSGFLHLGGARTALYNYLFAKQNGGKLILRIEDTDRSRSTEKAINLILKDLSWLGLFWDEGPDIGGDYGPYRQRERTGLHKEYIEKLIKSGSGYYCFCTSEELQLQREEARKNKTPFRYRGKCKKYSGEELEKKLKKKIPFTIRFATENEGSIIIEDIIRGRVEFRKEEIGDFIIQRSDGTLTYNFAVAIDDALMEITHVIRGEDHLSNTPKQIMIYEALGFDMPQFAHLPMIFGFDKKPLSKRHGATSVSEYKDKGYFAEALLNYLALLGWSLDDKTTIISKDELIAKFNLKKVSKNPAVWDIKKLEWMNGYYMRNKSLEELIKSTIPLFEEKGYKLKLDKKEYYTWLKSCFSIIRERAKTLKEIPELIEFLLSEEIIIDDSSWNKLFKEKDMSEKIMKLSITKIDNLQDWTVEIIEKALREIVEETGYKVKDVFQRIRIALTGKLVSPPLFESIELAGKELTVKRLKNSLVKIREEN